MPSTHCAKRTPSNRNHHRESTSNLKKTDADQTTPGATGHPQQWLVPILSPSEGLVYKPYSPATGTTLRNQPNFLPFTIVLAACFSWNRTLGAHVTCRVALAALRAEVHRLFSLVLKKKEGVVPHDNARSATRIFRSIQEGRQQPLDKRCSFVQFLTIGSISLAVSITQNFVYFGLDYLEC